MSEATRPPEPFDFANWEGDVDELEPVQKQLLYSEELCDLTFCSKGEAFASGHQLGRADSRRDEESRS
jgi:hypothetical protein